MAAMSLRKPFSASCALALLMLLASCGKKKEDSAEAEGPQSPQGVMLEAATKAVDQANERSANVKEALGRSGE